MTTAILAEKFSQAVTYSTIFEKSSKKKGYIEIQDKLFPDGAIITWGVGHLIELEMARAYGKAYERWSLSWLPLVPKASDFKLKVSEKTSDQYKVVESILKKCNDIIIATDAGREGELIAYSILKMANVAHKPIKRMWTNKLVESDMKEAFQNLKNSEETYGYYVEAETRQFADWLIGINGSPLVSILLNNHLKNDQFVPFSLGRVQTPTLYMIYENDKRIENFSPETFYDIKGICQSEKDFSVELKEKKSFKSKEELNTFMSENKLKIGLNSGYVKEANIQTKYQDAPELYNLTNLQKEASKKYGFTANGVLDILQSLYDAGFVTYPRTDCKYIGLEEFLAVFKQREKVAMCMGIPNDWKNDQPNKMHVDDEKVEEHSALMITSKIPDYKTMNEEQRIIYSMVAVSNLKMFESPYIFDSSEILVSVEDVDFSARGRVDRDLGWKRLDKYLIEPPTKKKAEKKEISILPNLEKGMSLKVTLSIHEGETKAPQMMTESRLLSLMENPNVESDEDRKILKQTSGIGTVATRASIIEGLKSKEYIKDTKGKLTTTLKGKILCESIEGTLLSNASMTANWEKYLKEIHKGNASQEIFLQKIEVFLNDLIKKLPQRIEDKKAIFSALSENEKNKNKICDCPNGNCKGIIVLKQLDGGKKTKLYGCTEYKKGCKVILPYEFSGKKLTETTIKDLISKGMTRKIKGFKSKNKEGKEFSAKLHFDKNTNKISFVFE